MAWDGSSRAPSGGDEEVEVVAGNAEADLVGRNWDRCFVSSRGPRAFTWKLSNALAASIWDGDFSTCRIPGRVRARRSGVSGYS